MTITTTDTPKPEPLAARLFKRTVFGIPILGRMLREVVYGDKDNIYYFLFSVLCLWFFAVLTWGWAAFILPFTVIVPAMFVVLLLITVGK